MEIAVSRDRTFQAAMRCKADAPTRKVAVLNFANAFQPGGGVKEGAPAQEESLCRCSTLYPLLDREYTRDNFYDYHEDLGTLKASDALIYTGGVVICKTDTDLPERLPEEDWVRVDVITAAAPDLRPDLKSLLQLGSLETPIAKPLSFYLKAREELSRPSMSAAELFACHVKRAMHILTVAAAHKANVLILGAFGCGAFRNDPHVVARAWKTALNEFPKVFERVEFAIYCRDEETENYRAFREAFAPEAI